MAKTKTTKVAKKITAAPVGPRQKKLTKKQQRQVAKEKTKKLSKLPSSFSLTRNSLSFFSAHWRTMLSIAAVYLILNIVLVRGVNGGVDVSGLKNSLDQAVGSSGNQFSSAINVFGNLLGSSGSSAGGQASLLQILLLVYESLVLIWVYRQIFSGSNVKVKQAYYSSTSQLIPFVLALAVILIQCLPLIIGSAVYGLVVSNGLDSTFPEKVVWFGLLFLGIFWTVRMVSSSIFSLYIVTLPEMLPLRALRSARQLVRYRRLVIIRRLIFLPLVVLLMMGLVVIPLIIFVAPLAGPMFYVLATLALLFAHLYMYNLYRELLV